jgi:hypothetical protein
LRCSEAGEATGLVGAVSTVLLSTREEVLEIGVGRGELDGAAGPGVSCSLATSSYLRLPAVLLRIEGVLGEGEASHTLNPGLPSVSESSWKRASTSSLVGYSMFSSRGNSAVTSSPAWMLFVISEVGFMLSSYLSRKCLTLASASEMGLRVDEG